MGGCRSGLGGLRVGLGLLPTMAAADPAAATVAERSTAWTTMLGLDAEVWRSLTTLGQLSLGMAVVALAFGLVMLARGKGRVALRAVMLAAASLSFGAMGGYARVAPYFSVEEMAPMLRELSDRGVRIAYDGGSIRGVVYYFTWEMT